MMRRCAAGKAAIISRRAIVILVFVPASVVGRPLWRRIDCLSQFDMVSRHFQPPRFVPTQPEHVAATFSAMPKNQTRREPFAASNSRRDFQTRNKAIDSTSSMSARIARRQRICATAPREPPRRRRANSPSRALSFSATKPTPPSPPDRCFAAGPSSRPVSLPLTTNPPLQCSKALPIIVPPMASGTLT